MVERKKTMKQIIFDETENHWHYFDCDGVELLDGDIIVHKNNGREEKLYLTDEGRLGTDATNPIWIKCGKASPCEYGIYPLEDNDMEDARLLPINDGLPHGTRKTYAEFEMEYSARCAAHTEKLRGKSGV